MNQHSESYKNLYSWIPPQRPPWGQKKVAVENKFKQQSIYGLSAEKIGRCGEVAVGGGLTAAGKKVTLKFPLFQHKFQPYPLTVDERKTR